MSGEDSTQHLPGSETKPTLEAVIHRIDRLGALIVEQFRGVETRLDRIDYRLDRIEAMALETRADLRDLESGRRDRRTVPQMVIVFGGGTTLIKLEKPENHRPRKLI